MLKHIAGALVMMLALSMWSLPGMAAGTGTLVLETDSGEHRYEVEVATTDQ